MASSCFESQCTFWGGGRCSVVSRAVGYLDPSVRGCAKLVPVCVCVCFHTGVCVCVRVRVRPAVRKPRRLVSCLVPLSVTNADWCDVALPWHSFRVVNPGCGISCLFLN